MTDTEKIIYFSTEIQKTASNLLNQMSGPDFDSKSQLFLKEFGTFAAEFANRHQLQTTLTTTTQTTLTTTTQTTRSPKRSAHKTNKPLPPEERWADIAIRKAASQFHLPLKQVRQIFYQTPDNLSKKETSALKIAHLIVNNYRRLADGQ